MMMVMFASYSLGFWCGGQTLLCFAPRRYGRSKPLPPRCCCHR
jgi:hypothetical protein